MAKIKNGKRLLKLVGEYVELCFGEDSKKRHFANVAGFCKYAGISTEEFRSMKRLCPEEYEAACACFEDAALNSGATASLIGMYLKQYGFWSAPADDEVCCDHDIFDDGI